MNILIVDDNQAIIASLRALLLSQGYNVDIANHGLAGSEKVQKHAYDLVLIDHLMPIMNGIQLTKYLRQQECYANLPVIFMTSQGHKIVESICDPKLFTAIIDKPIIEENLLSLVNDILMSNSSFQSL